MGKTTIATNLIKTSVRLGKDGQPIEKKVFPSGQKRQTKEERIAELEEELNKLKQ